VCLMLLAEAIHRLHTVVTYLVWLLCAAVSAWQVCSPCTRYDPVTAVGHPHLQSVPTVRVCSPRG
jgi:hypothetical protein